MPVSPLAHAQATIILAVIAALSLKLRFLDPKGVAASIIIGYAIIIFGGLNYFAILLSFFIISSIITRIRVKIVGELSIDKEWIRSWKNVLANGLAPTLAILIPKFLLCDERVMAAGYLGAVGTAFADTLATEIGLFYRGKPRLITSLQKVEKGTPGAVSPYGYLGCTIALLIIMIIAWMLKAAPPKIAIMLIPIGIIGATVDSLLGAGVQGKYRCRECGKIVENPHHCEKPAEHISGLKSINTHMVNFISTSLGAILLAAVAAL